MISGEYHNALDDKGRLLIPSRIRNIVEGNFLVITRGVERCLWMFTQEKWEQITSRIMEELSIFKERDRLINRQFLAPAQEVEIDKAGRITIPPTLRLAAELKRDTVILASDKYIEIWDEEERLAYSRASEENFKEAAEDLGIRLSI